ncbi:MAG TPA: phosphoribosylformylglycinamidine synthase, partial [Clostridium sp.]|nr:phosphoribosylformylglycinamidine synthase [Clostridium sp.]
MRKDIFTVFVEKKPNFNLESENLLRDFKHLLRIDDLKDVRVINRYDIEGINESEYKEIKNSILSESNIDKVYDGDLKFGGRRAFSVEYVPGQYDQRADSAAQCIQIITQKEMPKVKSS